jgi:hypothetical protein
MYLKASLDQWAQGKMGPIVKSSAEFKEILRIQRSLDRKPSKPIESS